MKLSASVLALSSLFLISCASCSISVSAECRTGKKIVLDQFNDVTNALFEKLNDIAKCGDNNISSFDFRSNDYKNCISRLNLPSSYEKDIANLSSFHFKNDFDFRDAISTAASRACLKLNYEHFFEEDDIALKTYRITGFASRPTTNSEENLKAPKVYKYSPPSTSSISTSSSGFDSFGNFVIIMLFGFIVVSLLLFGVVFLFAKWGRDNLPDKYVSEIHIKRDPVSSNADISSESNTSVVTIESYAVKQNEMPPPPSYEEIRMEFPSSPVNNFNSMEFIGKTKF